MAKRAKKKYNNKKVEIDGILFDSNLEGKVYIALKDMQERGLISQLETHPRWELQPKLTESYIKHLKTKDKVCERTILQPIYYTADFSFIQNEKLRVIDVKGSKYVISKDFPLRVKILRFKYGIDVHVVYSLKDLSIYDKE